MSQLSKYYFCKAGQRLRNELNADNPDRDKRSDGWIGDASHAARKSDHNPDWEHNGIVIAFDIDNDGVDVDKLIALLIKDHRVHYVIWNRHIWSREHNFVKRAYTGKSPHTEHVHVSFLLEFANDGAPFGYYKPKPAAPVAPTHTPTPTHAPARKSDSQIADEVVDGKWGSGSDRATRLKKAGYDPATIQAIVNRRMRTTRR